MPSNAPVDRHTEETGRDVETIVGSRDSRGYKYCVTVHGCDIKSSLKLAVSFLTLRAAPDGLLAHKLAPNGPFALGSLRIHDQ